MSATSLEAQLRAAGLDWIVPPLPCARARGLVTTRSGGVSAGEYGTMNLARHAGDDPDAVAENRRRLQAFLPSPPIWLEQVHGTTVAVLDGAAPAARIVADAAVTRTRGRRGGSANRRLPSGDLRRPERHRRRHRTCGLARPRRGRTRSHRERAADARRQGAGRRRLDRAGNRSARAFEVGPDVHAAFCAHDPAAAFAFVADRPGKWKADLGALARARLAAAGVGTVAGGGFCTHDEPARFFSYRRAPLSGRMASLAWLADDTGRN